MSQDAARVGEAVRVQQQARGFQGGRADDEDARGGVIVALRMPVEEVDSIDQAGIAIDRDFAGDGVGHDGELAGGEGRGEQQVGRARQRSGGAARLGGGHALLAGRGDEPLDAQAVGGVVLEEDSVGELREALAAPGHAEERLHAVVVRGEIGVGDGPVIAEAIVVLTLEFEVAETPGGAAPAEGAASDQADAHPIIRVAGRIGVRILLFVGPQVGVEFGCLGDVGETSGAAEAAIGKIVDGAEFAAVLEIEGRAGIQHQTANAQAGESVGGHAAGCARADDDYVVIGFHSSEAITIL